MDTRSNIKNLTIGACERHKTILQQLVLCLDVTWCTSGCHNSFAYYLECLKEDLSLDTTFDTCQFSLDNTFTVQLFKYKWISTDNYPQQRSYSYSLNNDKYLNQWSFKLEFFAIIANPYSMKLSSRNSSPASSNAEYCSDLTYTVISNNCKWLPLRQYYYKICTPAITVGRIY